ncbi:MAG TPA: response regulator transcription factor [Thermodesulfovibrionales bacterium]|nr:response regulator transcription factor [Thermodesulfovibrionales bacterium]
MIKILIADDHAVVREGVKYILSEMPDIKVAGEACNGYEALDKIGKNDYDLILLDIAMPGRDGLEILKDIKALKPKLPVMILSMFPEEQYALRALKSGASGYLTKDSIPDELIKALRKVLTGGKYVSSSFSDRLLFSLDSDADRPLHEALSDREYQVLRLIASGKTIKDIADEMSLSVKTVSTYRSRILEKMDMKNNAELTHYAIKHRLVD